MINPRWQAYEDGYSQGASDGSGEGFGLGKENPFRQHVEAVVSLELPEEERQMVLLALARLSVERPGWLDALHTLALQIDSQENGAAIMFTQFRELAASERVRERRADKDDPNG